MTRKNHDLVGMEQLARIMFNHTMDTQIQIVVNWMRSFSKEKSELPVVSDILEKVLGFKYFTHLKTKLSEDDYVYFLTHLTLEHRDRGSIILEKGKKNDSFYIILQGEVLILDEIQQEIANNAIKDSKDNQNSNTEAFFEKINILKPGDTFGEVSLLYPKTLTTARVVAKTSNTFSRTLNRQQHMKFSQKLQYFRENTLFEGITENKIKELLPEVREISYSLNQHVYEIGDFQEQMYFIVEGEAQLLNHNNKRLVILSPKEFFGVNKPNLQSGPRKQYAVSKSQNFVVYRIFFKRFSILGNELSIFMRNLKQNLQKKIVIYQELQRNHLYIENILKNPNSVCERKKQRKKVKTNRSGLKPSLQWWGVTNSNMKSTSAYRIKNRLLNTEPSPNSASMSGFSSVGLSKLDSLIRTTKSSAAKIRQSLQEKSNFRQSQYIPPGCLQNCFGKKTLKTGDNTPKSNIQLRKRLIPKITKLALLKYAKSSENYCEVLYLE